MHQVISSPDVFRAEPRLVISLRKHLRPAIIVCIEPVLRNKLCLVFELLCTDDVLNGGGEGQS
jgi:hypothetical protein